MSDDESLLWALNGGSKADGVILFSLIHSSNPCHTFCAHSEEEMQNWIKAIILEQNREDSEVVQHPNESETKEVKQDEELELHSYLQDQEEKIIQLDYEFESQRPKTVNPLIVSSG